jgi:hypothetical protein
MKSYDEEDANHINPTESGILLNELLSPIIDQLFDQYEGLRQISDLR